MRTIFISLLLSFSLYAYSSEEDYFGKYTSVNNGIKIEFTLNEDGVSNLYVDNIKFDSIALTYDYLAIYGNAQIFQINFEDNKKCGNVIKLFIVKNDGEFVITTGYYMKYKISEKEKMIVIRKQALELICKKL
jgi:hypothetical protein